MSVVAYPPHEQRDQMNERARRILAGWADWHGSVEEAEFCHSMLGSAVPFSGDARPEAGASRQSVWAELKRTSLLACPHWAPGRITYRRGCTACEANEPSDPSPTAPETAT
jgi:hypothetical protein